jgi:outer membrane protein assembly factor BamB
MVRYVKLSSLITGLLLGGLLAACGGGGGAGSGSPSIPIASTPTAAPTPNPNVDAGDTAADWTFTRYDPSGSGDNASQTAITKANVASLMPTWIFHGTVGSLSSVAVSRGMVYRTEEGGNTYAVNEATGAQIWNYAPIAPEGFDASPIVAAGSVYLPSTTGAFYVVSSVSGQYEFNYPPPAAWGPLIDGTELRAHYRAAPVYENGTLYIGASNHVEPINCMQGGQVLALDPLSPATRAIATLTNGTTGVGVWTSPVFDASGNMFVATGNTCDATNEPYGDSMLRLDPNSLAVIWSTPGPIDADDLDFGATPVVVDDEVIDGGKDGNVYAYDTSSGQLLWKQSAFPNGEVLGALATDGRYVVVTYAVSTDSQHGGIAVFDLHGNLVWSLLTGEDPADNKGILSAPAVSQGMVFIGYTQPNCMSQCDGLGAFDLATGKPLWWYATPSPIFGGIVVVQGGVFANEVGNPTTYCFQPASIADIRSRRPGMTYGTHAGGSAYFHDPWLTRTSYDGDNSGQFRP